MEPRLDSESNKEINNNIKEVDKENNTFNESVTGHDSVNTNDKELDEENELYNNIISNDMVVISNLLDLNF